MPGTTRREFAKVLTVAGAAIATPDPAAGQSRPGEKGPHPLGLALAGVVRAQFGQHLSDDEMARIGSDFQDYVPLVERLRRFELKNSDEPDFTFAALTDRW